MMSIRRNPTPVMEGLGSRLSEVLAERRLSQLALARRLNASPGFVSDLARGQKAPGAEFLVALHDVLGVNVQWLLTSHGNKYGSDIDPDVLQNLFLEILVIRGATIEGRPEAIAALRAAHPNLPLPEPQREPDEREVAQYLQSLAKQSEDLALAISIFNRVMMQVPPEERAAAREDALVELVRSRRTPSILSALKSGRPNQEAHASIGSPPGAPEWNPKPIAPGRKIGDVLTRPELGELDRRPRTPRASKKAAKRSR